MVGRAPTDARCAAGIGDGARPEDPHPRHSRSRASTPPASRAGASTHDPRAGSLAISWSRHGRRGRTLNRRARPRGIGMMNRAGNRGAAPLSRSLARRARAGQDEIRGADCPLPEFISEPRPPLVERRGPRRSSKARRLGPVASSAPVSVDPLRPASASGASAQYGMKPASMSRSYSPAPRSNQSVTPFASASLSLLAARGATLDLVVNS